MNDLQKLQEKIAYQEDAVEKLSDALATQQQQMMHLQQQTALLTQLIKQWRQENHYASVVVEPQDISYEIPPHY